MLELKNVAKYVAKKIFFFNYGFFFSWYFPFINCNLF